MYLMSQRQRRSSQFNGARQVSQTDTDAPSQGPPFLLDRSDENLCIMQDLWWREKERESWKELNLT